MAPTLKTRIIALLELIGSVLAFVIIGGCIAVFMGGSTGMIVVHGIVIIALIMMRSKLWPSEADRTRPDGAGARALPQRAWVLLLAGIALIWLPAQILSQYLEIHAGLGRTQEEGPQTLVAVILAAALALLFAPVGEESFMRGILFVRLRRAFGFWTCAVITSVVFALLHGNPMQIVLTLPLGLLLALSVEITGRIRYAIAGHMLFNALGVGASLLGRPAELIQHATGEMWVVLLCIPTLVILTWASISRLLAFRSAA